MQFDLTDEQKQIFDTVQELLRDADAAQAPVERFDAGDYAQSPVWAALRDMGLIGMLPPEARGGMGDELLTLAIVAEAIGYAGVGTPIIHQALAAWILAASDVVQPLLDEVIGGTRIVALALGEAPDGWSPDRWTLAGGVLDGSKMNVVGGDDADLFIVGLAGGTFGLVERGDGVTVTPVSSVDRTRPIATVDFANAPARPLILPEGMATRLFDAMLIVDAADAFGAARRALDLTVDYVQTREQFGRPIGAFQAIKHQLADMAVDVEPCRAMVWYAAHAWDRQRDDASRTAALTNAHITDVAVRTARAATEAHGGMGFTWEYPLHIWLKRAIADRAHLGGSGEQRARVAKLSAW